MVVLVILSFLLRCCTILQRFISLRLVPLSMQDGSHGALVDGCDSVPDLLKSPFLLYVIWYNLF